MLRGGGRGVHVGRGGQALVQFAGTLRARAPHRARPRGAPHARAPAGAAPWRRHARRAPATRRAPAAPAAGPVHLQHTHTSDLPHPPSYRAVDCRKGHVCSH
ncbi:unnamed protein product [Euphydryas editha]|uniref:Uncharacterized protein n=1 Tax=Euphydryas editha TaxID=104508 RepID=A0AAU9TI66_EUPED|nr:unnamed protein product [Euphydryas editha]